MTNRQRAFNHTLLLLFAFFALYPLVNLFFLAINSPRSLQTGLGWPNDPRLSNFVDAWNAGGFGSAFEGSFLIAISVVVGASVSRPWRDTPSGRCSSADAKRCSSSSSWG